MFYSIKMRSFFSPILFILFIDMAFVGSLSEIQAKDKNKLRAKEEALSLKLGNSLYEENRLDESLYIFRDFIDLYPDSDRRIQVLQKIAEIFEEKQEFIAAQKIYHQLFQELGFSSQGLLYHFQEARLLEIMGNSQEAKQIYNIIIKALPDSDLALRTKRRLQLNQLFDSTKANMMDSTSNNNAETTDP